MSDPDAAAGRPDAAGFLARILPLARAVGVTRLAMLTGLDTLAIPVAAAIRPNSRSVAVHQGKGLGIAAAKVSALMEALECHCAETLQLPLRLGSAAELAGCGDVVDIAALPLAGSPPDPATRLLWVEGRCLLSGRPVWAPRELVAADFTADAGGGPALFQATTNGLASGATLADATRHALCEVIERDAIALFHARGRAAQAALRVDLDSVTTPASRALLRHLAERDTEVAVWDATADTGLPVFLALLSDPSGRVQPETGAACHPDPDIALLRALLEAAQARLTCISGARDDFAPDSYGIADQRGRADAARALRDGGGSRPFSPAPHRTDILDSLARAGITTVACVELTQPGIGIPVVRVVVPGLEGAWTGHDGEYRPGRRAQAIR